MFRMKQESEEFRVSKILCSILPSTIAVKSEYKTMEGKLFLRSMQGTFILAKNAFSRKVSVVERNKTPKFLNFSTLCLVWNKYTYFAQTPVANNNSSLIVSPHQSVSKEGEKKCW